MASQRDPDGSDRFPMPSEQLQLPNGSPMWTQCDFKARRLPKGSTNGPAWVYRWHFQEDPQRCKQIHILKRASRLFSSVLLSGSDILSFLSKLIRFPDCILRCMCCRTTDKQQLSGDVLVLLKWILDLLSCGCVCVWGVKCDGHLNRVLHWVCTAGISLRSAL